MSWALVWTAPGAEGRASLHLGQQGFEHHAFRLRERVIDCGRIVWKDRYMFPRYIFAKVNNLWQSIRNTRGVIDVVRIGYEPAIVPDKVVTELLNRRDPDGLISIGPTQWSTRFRPGQAVRVNEGPLIGYHGVFDSANGEGRVKVLLEMLGAQTPVVLAESDLAECVAEQTDTRKKYRPRRRRHG
jgi:transcriptional antiterminator RfaH